MDIEANVSVEVVAIADLSSDWRTYPAPPALAKIGERWLQESKTAVLSVPSVVIPQERNFALNPKHVDFARLVIHPAEPFSFDPRMRTQKDDCRVPQSDGIADGGLDRRGTRWFASTGAGACHHPAKTRKRMERPLSSRSGCEVVRVGTSKEPRHGRARRPGPPRCVCASWGGEAERAMGPAPRAKAWGVRGGEAPRICYVASGGPFGTTIRVCSVG